MRPLLIAIQSDNMGETSSDLWAFYLRQKGHDVKFVNVYAENALDQIAGCDGFMWRIFYDPASKQIARRLLPILEKELDIPIFPDRDTGWHYDDKISQSLLFKIHRIPTPKNWIFFTIDEAIEWAKTVHYPVVLKLAIGSGSKNVRLIRTKNEAFDWIEQIFSQGVYNLRDNQITPLPLSKKRLITGLRLLFRGKPIPRPERWWEIQKDYIYFQEYIPNNDYDTRITIIGNRAFGFRRKNANNDFRASGSGNIDYTPSKVDTRLLSLGFFVSKKLNTQSCALDFLWKNETPVLTEISYTYLSNAIYKCPGYWDETLVWHDGQIWPEEAHVDEFLKYIKQRRNNKHS